MRIIVTGINTDEAVLVRGTSALGWRGTFGCPLVTGDAVFIPARGFEHNLRVGNEVVVETSFESISGLHIIPVSASNPETMHAIDGGRDYFVRGTVVFNAPEGLIRVSVRGFVFTLDREELGGLEPQSGDILEFNLHGLTLWDANV